MNIRVARAELEKYIKDKEYLDEKLEDIERLTEQINKITATYSDMPRGGSTSKEELIAKKIELEKETYGYLMDLLNQRAVIERAIRNLEPGHRNVLDYIYIKGKTLTEYSEKIKYSYSQCKRILKDAYIEYAQERSKESN